MAAIMQHHPHWGFLRSEVSTPCDGQHGMFQTTCKQILQAGLSPNKLNTNHEARVFSRTDCHSDRRNVHTCTAFEACGRLALLACSAEAMGGTI